MGTAGGALGGAMTGAKLGSIVPGVGTAVGAVAGGLLGGLGGSGLFGGGQSTSSGLPSWNYQYTPDQMLQNSADIFNQAQQQGIDFARAGTQANIRNQNRVTPGSSQQRQLAQNQINQYIQGQIPLDVQQNINRQVAQNLGGGFNLFSGGGQAPQNFARNIGQTSLGLSQFGLSAAPTWQQLANQMVVRPEIGMQAGLQASGQALSMGQLGMQSAESAYQAAMNQYAANQLANQQQSQMGMQLGQMGMQAYGALDKSQYLNSLSPSGRGYQATIGGLPAAQFAGSMVPLSSAPLDVQQKYGWGQFGTGA